MGAGRVCRVCCCCWLGCGVRISGGHWDPKSSPGKAGASGAIEGQMHQSPATPHRLRHTVTPCFHLTPAAFRLRMARSCRCSRKPRGHHDEHQTGSAGWSDSCPIPGRLRPRRQNYQSLARRIRKASCFVGLRPPFKTLPVHALLDRCPLPA
ncbi:hypothetical protein VTI28DRAFT_4619 [Corynascus sepedonium]